MSSIEETLAALRREVRSVLETVMESVLTKVRRALEGAEQERAEGLVHVAEERVKGLIEVAEERAKGLAEVDARRTELSREIAAMHRHQEAQEGRVKLNIGGHRFETSVQTLRRVLHTFFDAYFSGRYAQDVCNDGSIFVDRDGERFGHVLEYMRDGHLSMAEAGARPSLSLLRALKREFGFYSIELCTEQSEQGKYLAQADFVFMMCGKGDNNGVLSSMERYDVTSGQWVVAAAISTARCTFGACAVAGELYVTGGRDGNNQSLSIVEKYSLSNDTWSTMAPLHAACTGHAAVAVGCVEQTCSHPKMDACMLLAGTRMFRASSATTLVPINGRRWWICWRVGGCLVPSRSLLLDRSRSRISSTRSSPRPPEC
jgi:hypothetical protein